MRLAGVALLVLCGCRSAVSPLPCAIDPVTARLVGAALEVQAQIRDVHLANLANVDTIGWKRRVPQIRAVPIDAVSGAEVPVFVGTTADFSAGTLEVSNRWLDLAVDGEGMFAVLLADGTLGYTRNGSFQVDAGGRIVTREGRALVPMIIVPSDVLEICIDPEGKVCGRTAADPDRTTAFGTIQLHRFANCDGLESIGDATFRSCDAAGPPASSAPGSNGFGHLKQGFLERSNVERIRELVALDAAAQTRQHLLAVANQLGLQIVAR